ncbi:HupE/UreJ family protein [Thermoleptolyngbya sichuanensis A183]|uniref:HupE/UreJ family protein n=1 Tax=Thermoleptolyngbya sichuanensis A183 TaxID=2737172 RepID=A0A6M8BCI5_9CYAN|nr:MULTISPECIES: HupE/UreJ family protein [Thermoleptolyngbya]QKD81816.1 HupE/UreJ family protein [Thermoleptolyngbya sichuanensis A183]
MKASITRTRKFPKSPRARDRRTVLASKPGAGWRSGALLLLAGMALCAEPALAHHALGGETPKTFLEGFLSGLAHPVIGLDHFAFVVAIGLLAAKQGWGLLFPISFLLAALGGTTLHLNSVDLPAVEIAIALSVFLIGLGLGLQKTLPLGGAIAFGVLAGVFHGYAYGESIIGATPSPLSAYLLGFTLIQAAIALGAGWLGDRLLRRTSERARALTLPGLAIAGVGLVFLLQAI